MRLCLQHVSIIFLLCVSASACGQTKADKKVGGDCEGCEALFEYGDRALDATDTLPDFHEQGPKLLVTGTIFQSDGRTPAKNVILYIYHTDQKGEYPVKGNERNWARRHGFIRGWIKTGGDGKYSFYTLRPAAYAGRQNPEHIHPVIKEPGYTAYWIDEYLFDDDPILTPVERNRQEGRGGNGIVQVTRQGALMIARRDIILGRNIPGY